MTYRQAFVEAVRTLSSGPHPTETPDLDARVLLGHAAGLTHAALLARWSDLMPEHIGETYRVSLIRRLEGEPVAWITGFKEFLGMDFEVGPGLLVPRADTETLVEAALEVLACASDPVPAAFRAVDLCTGTGCVAVGLAALAPRILEVWACDLSPLAVETARKNAARLLEPGRKVSVVESDLMNNLSGGWDLIVSNPPYLTPEETKARVDEGGWREPALALDGGGSDGLALIRRLVDQAGRALKPQGWLLLEAADAQMEAIAGLYASAGLKGIRFWKDLAGQRRVAGGTRATG